MHDMYGSRPSQLAVSPRQGTLRCPFTFHLRMMEVRGYGLTAEERALGEAEAHPSAKAIACSMFIARPSTRASSKAATPIAERKESLARSSTEGSGF
jgi:hypothetical protein